MKQVILLTITLCASILAFGQKKVIDHTVYNDWKSLKSTIISNDGRYVSYEITPHRGDGFLFIYDKQTGNYDSIPRGTGAKFTGGSTYLLFKITPGFDTLRTCELEKIDKKKWPKDSLGIYNLKKDSVIKIAKYDKFFVNDENDWYAYTVEPKKKPAPKKKLFKKKTKEPEYKSDGKELHLIDPDNDKKLIYDDVRDVLMADNGKAVSFVLHRKYDKEEQCWINIDHYSGAHSELLTKYTDIQNMVFDEEANQLVFLSSSDTSKVKNYQLYLVNPEEVNVKMLVDTTALFMPESDAVSRNFSPRFNKDGNLIYFGVAEKERPEPKDTLVKSEKVELDLWHYKDKRLQPQQLKELKRDEKRTDLYVYHINDGHVVQLSDDTLEVHPNTKQTGEFLLGVSNERYAHTYNWTIPYPEDHYLISIKTGERTLIKEGVEFGGRLSPSSEYYTFFDSKTMQHYAVSLSDKKEYCLTCKSEEVFWQEDVNGMPMKAYPLGIIGWKEGEDKVWIQSEYDIWEYSFNDDTVIAITNLDGQLNKIKMTPDVWSWDSVYIDYSNLYVNGFDEKTKGQHFYKLIDHDNHSDLIELNYFDAMVSAVYKAKNSDDIIFRLQTFQKYPDLYISNTEFNNPKQITVTNPQQSEYNWGTVELINWTSYEGIELEGLLYKPENFDPNKKYPLLVYYYELRSNSLHRHYIPKPTASIIYPTEYASAGYLVLIPDIRYTPGYPARSAYDCIMSATDRAIELVPNIDTTRMGLQGQSWGGYQTAQLITMTNRYAAAMAGAPVSNMFSAYGGIRWGSGLNRQFQYERTQSRIGYTIWEKPELYYENSPLFHLPNVTTPLLIMHNDKDGAVPWYQGIELFTGMKRLNKRVWLLNYNGDDHNLMQNANRIDLSIRMRSFFDYYLLEKEAPQWLIEGIPATVKGKELRY